MFLEVSQLNLSKIVNKANLVEIILVQKIKSITIKSLSLPPDFPDRGWENPTLWAHQGPMLIRQAFLWASAAFHLHSLRVFHYRLTTRLDLEKASYRLTADDLTDGCAQNTTEARTFLICRFSFTTETLHHLETQMAFDCMLNTQGKINKYKHAVSLWSHTFQPRLTTVFSNGWTQTGTIW